MREDLTHHGIQETRTSAQVDDALLNSGDATVLMVVNSVCGCAAGKARPGVVYSLQGNGAKPTKTVTVFAGADTDAVDRVRELSPGIPPSSPAIYLFQNGKPVYVLPRHGIENRQAPEIAFMLQQAFAEHCKPVEV